MKYILFIAVVLLAIVIVSAQQEPGNEPVTPPVFSQGLPDGADPDNAPIYTSPATPVLNVTVNAPVPVSTVNTVAIPPFATPIYDDTPIQQGSFNGLLRFILNILRR